jgi:hypothetical protein
MVKEGPLGLSPFSKWVKDRAVTQTVQAGEKMLFMIMSKTVHMARGRNCPKHFIRLLERAARPHSLSVGQTLSFEMIQGSSEYQLSKSGSSLSFSYGACAAPDR